MLAFPFPENLMSFKVADELERARAVIQIRTTSLIRELLEIRYSEIELSAPSPSKHNKFSSHAGSLEVSIPLIINEYEITGVTVFANKTDSSANSSATVKIVAGGPLVLKEAGGLEEKSQIIKVISVPGNDSFQIQSPKKYDYPSGKEGDCLAQANVCLRKIETIEKQEIATDSLSIDLYIKRKLVNVYKSMWTSLNGLTNIGSSAVITALIAIFAYFVGQDLASLIPYFVITFLLLLAIVSVAYSWIVRDRVIRKRLEDNFMFQQLKEREH
jgi:hypothetical protein